MVFGEDRIVFTADNLPDICSDDPTCYGLLVLQLSTLGNSRIFCCKICGYPTKVRSIQPLV